MTTAATEKEGVVYLKDYRPPVFGVDTLHLAIDIHDDHTAVQAQLEMHRNTEGDLVLNGTDLELKSITLNDRVLTPRDYTIDDNGDLTIHNAPDRCSIKTEVVIHPETNTQLEGLYKADTMFCTQNEAQGFRRITFFPDRPDVLTVYTTRIEADVRYPTLLANGNRLEHGSAGDGRHYAIWHDPTHKPSYLFACVAADLAMLPGSFTTMSGKIVALEIYALAHDLPKCQVAMQALKEAMRWDEVNYGREYDLDLYMVVAVGKFNAGAMENKGLNIFDTACILSDPMMTTDTSNFYVKTTVAHEYFHNWTGNRITCRDWFQLCLKEGFTVFRDQSFATTLQSAAVQRIDEVAVLKDAQFDEDSGPLSHPPRPDHFVEISNFYTSTVYDKGAEAIRMMAKWLGHVRYRKATDEYFRRFDGMAVTVEDLLDAFSDGSGVDLRSFISWYIQPGTPSVRGHSDYDAAQGQFTLHLEQEIPKKNGYPEPKPMPTPVSIALFDRATGHEIPFPASEHFESDEPVVLLTKWSHDFVFDGIKTSDGQAPLVSVLRDFSAPVHIDFQYSDDDYAFLLEHETNGYNRWQAAQKLLDRVFLEGHDLEDYLVAMAYALPLIDKTDKLLASRLVDVPTENYIASRLTGHYDPKAVHDRREDVLNRLAQRTGDFWPATYASLPIAPYADNAEAMGVRAWRNIALNFCARLNHPQTFAWATAQYDQANCMTERLGALRVLVNYDAPNAKEKLADFYNRFKAEPLAIDLWFSTQASRRGATIADVIALTQLPDFDWTVPNRVRSVIGAFTAQPVGFWTRESIQFYADVVLRLNEQNAIMASNILKDAARWYTLVEPMRSQAQGILEGLRGRVKASSVKETLINILTNKDV